MSKDIKPIVGLLNNVILKGDKGDKGEAFVYSDFTAEQLKALRGPEGAAGINGKDGEKGEPGTNAIISWGVNGPSLTSTIDWIKK